MSEVPFIVIVGLGISGQAVARYVAERSMPLLVVDDKPGVAKLWIDNQHIQCDVLDGRGELSRCDTLVPKTAWCVSSPGVPPDYPFIVKCRDRGIDVISEIEFALRVVGGSLPKMIAVTGTNGKTTVCELLCHTFRHAGKTCEAIGNIGQPVLELLSKHRELWPEWLVVEISSFQLETTYTPRFSVGCWLNLAPNHLDWHGTMDHYRRAKQRVASLVLKEGLFVCHQSVPLADGISEAPVVTYGQKTGDVTIYGQQIFLRGTHVGTLPEGLKGGFSHDVDNFLAAFAIGLWAGIDASVIEKGYNSFSRPRHRIEFVGEFENIKYFDDSKGTNIAATVAAVASVPGPVVLIAGGVHKGFSYASWKQDFQGKVEAIIAIGQAKELIASDVGDAIPVQFANSMQEAVKKSSCAVVSPCSVVLSPGCSSYDMFHDYKERGDRFQECVRALMVRS